MGLTYVASAITVLTDPASGLTLTIDPTVVSGQLELSRSGGAGPLRIPIDDPVSISALRAQIEEAHAAESGPAPRRGWAEREWSSDDAFHTSYTEREDDDPSSVEGSFRIGGYTPSGSAATFGPLSLGLAKGLSDELTALEAAAAST